MTGWQGDGLMDFWISGLVVRNEDEYYNIKN